MDAPIFELMLEHNPSINCGITHLHNATGEGLDQVLQVLHHPT